MVVYPRLVGVLLRGRSNWKGVAETDLFVLQHHPRQTLRPFRIITRGFPHYCVAEGESVEQLKAELDMLTREAREAIGGIIGLGMEGQGSTAPVKITSKKISNWLKGLTSEPVHLQRSNRTGLQHDNEDEDEDDNEVEVDIELEELDEQPLVDDVEMEAYDDLGMEVETLHPLQLSKLPQRRHVQEEDGYLSDLSTLSSESLGRSSKYSLGGKAVSGEHTLNSPMVLKERICVDQSKLNQDQQQPRREAEAYTLMDEQEVKADLFGSETGGETHMLPMPKAPKPRHRSILEDHDGLSFPFLNDREVRQMSKSDEWFEQSERPLSAPPAAPYNASPSVSPIITFPPEESPIARDIPPATHTLYRKYPPQSSLPLFSPTQSPTQSPELESTSSQPMSMVGVKLQQLHTIGKYGIEKEEDGRSPRTEASNTGGMPVKNPLRRRRTCQKEKEVIESEPVLLSQTNTQTDDLSPSTPHNEDNKHIGVLNPRRGSHDDIYALRSILKRARARSPTLAPKMPSILPLSAPVYGPSPGPGPPTQTISSPLPFLATIPSSTSLPTALNDQGQAEVQSVRQKSHATSPSFMSVPFGWFTNNGQMNTSYSGTGTWNRRRASDGDSVQTSNGNTKTQSADIGINVSTLTNTQSGSRHTLKSPGSAGHSRTSSSRSDRRNIHTSILDLPFHFIALLTYPEPATGQGANDAQRIVLEKQERTFVRQRRRALLLLSGFVMTVRYCSFDFFLVILIATNCGLLYLMKRSGQHMDVAMAKRVVHRKLNLVKSWSTGLFRQGPVENGGYSKEAPRGVGALGPGFGTMGHSNSNENIQRESIVGTKQSHGRTNKGSRTDSIGSTAKSSHSYKASLASSEQSPRTPRLEGLQLSQPRQKVKQDDTDTLLVIPSRPGTPALAPSLIAPGAALKKRRFFGKTKSVPSAVIVATSTTTPAVIANDMVQTPSASNSPVVSASNSPSASA